MRVSERFALVAWLASALLNGSCGNEAIEGPDETWPIQYGVLDRTFDLSHMNGWTGGFDQDLWDLYFEDGSTYGNPIHKISEWASPDKTVGLQINGWPTVYWVTSDMFDQFARQAAENLGVESFEVTTVGGFHSFEQRRSLLDGLVILDVFLFDEKYHDVHELSVFCDVRDLDRARSLVDQVITTARWKWIDRRLPLFGELEDDDTLPPEGDASADPPE